MPRLNRLVLRELPFRCILVVRCSSRSLPVVQLVCFVNLASIRCLGFLSLIRSFVSLSLSLGLVLFALLSLISSIGSVRRLSLLPVIYSS